MSSFVASGLFRAAVKILFNWASFKEYENFTFCFSRSSVPISESARLRFFPNIPGAKGLRASAHFGELQRCAFKKSRTPNALSFFSLIFMRFILCVVLVDEDHYEAKELHPS